MLTSSASLCDLSKSSVSLTFHSDLAVDLLHRGLLAEARDCIEQILVLDHNADGTLLSGTDRAAVLTNYGLILQQLGLLSETVRVLTSATEIADNPLRANSFFALGNAFKSVSMLSRANMSFSQALELDPNHAGAHTNKGIVLESMGKLRLAAESYRQAMAVLWVAAGGASDGIDTMGDLMRDERVRAMVMDRPELVAAATHLSLVSSLLCDWHTAAQHDWAVRHAVRTAQNVPSFSFFCYSWHLMILAASSAQRCRSAACDHASAWRVSV
jgi:tetratricopeptide (TPR) repeat protein